MQSIAVISDVHANLLALDAVLKDISERKIERIVNLGDVLFGPLDPVGTAKRLMELDHVVNIMGNCDEILLRSNVNSLTYQFVHPLLSKEILDWIFTFKKTWFFENLLFCHGTPVSNERYLLEETTTAGVTYKSVEHLDEELVEVQSDYILCGHSHVSKTVFVPKTRKAIVNVGSVGLPAYDDEQPTPHCMESLSPYAKYVILKKNNNNNHWLIEHIQVPYDWDRASDMAQQNARNDYAYAIKTGRVQER